jgi:hypothetical protein
MRKTIVIAIVLLSILPLAFGQAQNREQELKTIVNQQRQKAVETKALTRLAYRDNNVVQFGVGVGRGRVCFAFSPEGGFRLWRSATTEHAMVAAGTLQKSEMEQLQELIHKAGPARSSGIVRGMTRTLMLEVPNGRHVERHSWVSDQENPFPDPVTDVVEWLQNFKPEKTKLLRSRKSDVCPAPRGWPVPEQMASADSSGRL